MWISKHWKDYELIDCGGGEKLERWGDYILVRPDPQAIWQTPRTDPHWKRPDARYARSASGGWQWAKKDVPQRWYVHYGDLTFNIKPMNFKHTGLFPEQATNWDFCQEAIRSAGRPVNVLNLFAYTGGATIACAAAGAGVCHDFAAVKSVGTDVRSTVRTVYHFEIERQGQIIDCRVCANGFLYNMVRAMVGTVVYAAEGKFPPEAVTDILEGRCRTDAGPTAPPGGLYMTRLWYDEPGLNQGALT